MWEPTKGTQYAVLFSRILEVYSVEEDEAVHSVTFDTNQTSFTYLGESTLVLSDDKGRLTVFLNIDKPEGVEMHIVPTTYKRLKSLKASPDQSFVSVVTERSLALWGKSQLLDAFKQKSEDLMCEIDPL